MRHPKPAALLDHEERLQELRKQEPRLCWTCLHYDAEGQCQKWQMQPPREFADTPDACDGWEMTVPF